MILNNHQIIKRKKESLKICFGIIFIIINNIISEFVVKLG